ncbi:MAG: transporter substrate-binding domain-containing protein [Peptococcaceae bacterium]|jgi:polar amino acid transport system substrate-binding protein|nr:transporter substrate-binding domain-containing protein [Peptococcaceae bacterium]
MRKIAYLVLTGILLVGTLFLFTACDNTGDAEKLVCGVTKAEPMNYLDANGNWTGFDTEFALLVGEKLNMEVVFQEIDWNKKFIELEAGTINCIWNGFTANTVDSVTNKPRYESVDFSYSYMLNQQCVVVKKDRAAEFTSEDDLSGKKAAAEKGSAGETFAQDAVGDGGTLISPTAQINTFVEVKSGAVDFAVVDILLAQSLIGSGDYADMVIADITLESEVYAIGFKKGSEMTQKVNDAIMELYNDGTLVELAKKYGLENSLKIDTSPIR